MCRSSVQDIYWLGQDVLFFFFNMYFLIYVRDNLKILMIELLIKLKKIKLNRKLLTSIENWYICIFIVRRKWIFWIAADSFLLYMFVCTWFTNIDNLLINEELRSNCNPNPVEDKNVSFKHCSSCGRISLDFFHAQTRSFFLTHIFFMGGGGGVGG